MGQTLLLTPQGQDLEQQPASLPGLGAAWEALSTIPNLKPVQEELLGPKRSAEQYFFFPVPLFPLSSFVCSKLQFNAHHRVSKRRTSSVWRQRGEARAARRRALEAKPQHVVSNTFLANLFTYGLSPLCVARKNTRAKREEKMWSLGRQSARGGGAGAVATPKPPPCQGQTHHPQSMAACKDALS